jgi:hypothetical protein
MHPQPKFSLFIFLLMLVSLFTGVPALATTHIISPEDHSVYIDQRDPDINKSDKSGILTASEINENARIVIHFDLSGWGADSIFQAKLYLYHYRGGYYTDSRAINVYPLTSAFDEFTATWNFPWAIPGGDYDTSVSASADVPEEWENWVAWDVTELLMNRWNNIANCGFLLKDPVEDTPFDGPYVRFRSHRHLGEFPEEVPYLEISTEPTGVGDINAEAMPHSFWLGQNFPNPFNSSTLG